MILETNRITVSYGASQILFGVDVGLSVGETVCILGRNGVGKTTTLKTIMGILKPTNGSITFNGVQIGGMAPYKISRLGIAYVPQGRHIFPNLTTKENLLISMRKSDGTALDEWTIERVHELFPVLKRRENSKGGRLSGGEQQMLCIARALVQNPRLLLMDEIFEGLAPIVIKEIIAAVKRLKNSGVSILLAEQSLKFAREVAGLCSILEKGEVVYTGSTADITKETAIRYLGT